MDIVGTLILRLFLFCILLLVLGTTFITFLNRRTAKTDNKLYDPDYKAEELSSYLTDESIESEADPRSTNYYKF